MISGVKGRRKRIIPSLLRRYQDYCVINHPDLIVPVPQEVALDVAAMVSCSGITAYSAVGNLKESLEEAIKVKGNFFVRSLVETVAPFVNLLAAKCFAV